MKKKVFPTIAITFLITILLIIFHSSSDLALRTHVFFTGHPKVALTTTIIPSPREYETENLKFYRLDKAPVDWQTGNDMSTFKVVKKGFLYFASYHGEG